MTITSNRNVSTPIHGLTSAIMKQDTYRNFRTIGLIGLATQLVINLIVLLVFKRTEFFSEQWWSDFFPGYLVWFVFAVIGVAGAAGKPGT